MKTRILIVALGLFGSYSFGQFTPDNAPQIGESKTMYVIDSLASNFTEITGDDVVWDYSEVTGYDSETREVRVIDPADTSNGGVYSSSTKAFEMEDFFMSYMTESEDERRGQGFVFNAELLDIGAVSAKFNEDEVLMTYPFEFGDEISGDFTGTVTLFLGAEATLPLEGLSSIKVDGKGVLKIGETSIENVVRYAMRDTMYVYLGEDIENSGRVLITRTQFEYYNHEISKLPLFIHTQVSFEEELEEGVGMSFAVVLSSVDPATSSITENDMELITVYPNPATTEVSVSLPSTVQKVSVQVLDAQGKVVLENEVNEVSNKINISNLSRGTYTLQLRSEFGTITQSILKL